MDYEKEGTIEFWIRHEHKDWTTNANGYKFEEFEAFGIKVRVIKHPDNTLQIDLNGAHGKHYSMRERMPVPKKEHEGEVFVAITWNKNQVIFYLNGKPVKDIWCDLNERKEN